MIDFTRSWILRFTGYVLLYGLALDEWDLKHFGGGNSEPGILLYGPCLHDFRRDSYWWMRIKVYEKKSRLDGEKVKNEKIQHQRGWAWLIERKWRDSCDWVSEWITDLPRYTCTRYEIQNHVSRCSGWLYWCNTHEHKSKTSWMDSLGHLMTFPYRLSRPSVLTRRKSAIKIMEISRNLTDDAGSTTRYRIG